MPSLPDHRLFSFFTFVTLLNKCGLSGPKVDLYRLLAGLEFINLRFQVSLSRKQVTSVLFRGPPWELAPIQHLSELFKIEKSPTSGTFLIFT